MRATINVLCIITSLEAVVPEDTEISSSPRWRISSRYLDNIHKNGLRERQLDRGIPKFTQVIAKRLELAIFPGRRAVSCTDANPGSR
jgi:hypothetical protein